VKPPPHSLREARQGELPYAVNDAEGGG